MQGFPIWGDGGGTNPHQGVVPPHPQNFESPPHGDIGPTPKSKIFGELRAQRVVFILYFQLQATLGYIVILFNDLV